jgi:hypothetical protein
MVNWKSKANCGGHPPSRDRGRRGGWGADKARFCQGDNAAAPTGSGIIRHARLPHCQEASETRHPCVDDPLGPAADRTCAGPNTPSYPCLPAARLILILEHDAYPNRPHHVTAVSHWGQLLSRAGSPASWVPRLKVRPLVHVKHSAHEAVRCSGNLKVLIKKGFAKLCPHGFVLVA